MKALVKKVAGAGVYTTVAVVAALLALGTVATYGVAKSIDSKIDDVGRQIVTSCELNEAMKGSLNPTIELNEKASIVGGYIQQVLKTMRGMRDGLAAMVKTIGLTNDVLSGVSTHTRELSAALDKLVPYIEQLADAVEQGNLASESSIGILEEINGLNSAIAGQMAEMRAKLASSVTYKLLFTYVMPVLP